MIVRQGHRFGRLVTQSEAGRSADQHKLWLCRCDCGNECIRQSNNLKLSGMPSCGCAQRDLQSTHGMRGTPTYASWQSAIGRCHSLTNKDYYRYGAIGIHVCDRWRSSFEAFLADMGERPAGTTLDRWPNPRGAYEPGNCRWATPIEQSRNRKNSIYVEWNGARVLVAEIADQLGISVGAAHMRLRRGKLHDCA